MSRAESLVKRRQGDSDGPDSSSKRPRREQFPGIPDRSTGEEDGATAGVRGKSPAITSEEAESDDVFLSYDAMEGEADDVTAQVNRFFAELDVDTTKQRRRILAEGIKVGETAGRNGRLKSSGTKLFETKYRRYCKIKCGREAWVRGYAV